jgi:hypothetical protein
MDIANTIPFSRSGLSTLSYTLTTASYRFVENHCAYNDLPASKGFSGPPIRVSRKQWLPSKRSKTDRMSIWEILRRLNSLNTQPLGPKCRVNLGRIETVWEFSWVEVWRSVVMGNG